MGGTHYPVPKSKIEAVIAFEILVVHIVVNGCIEPFTKPMPVKPFGEKFVPKMTIYIVHRHENKKGKNMNEMYGYGKCKHINDTGFYYRFSGVKGKGCPGRRVGAFVMYDMEKTEQFRVVHHTVCKVKISIMHQQHYRKNNNKIQCSTLADIRINGCMGLYIFVIKHKWNQGKLNMFTKYPDI